MSDEAKEAMTPQEAEDVAAFLRLRRTGQDYTICNTLGCVVVCVKKLDADGVDDDGLQDGGGHTLAEAVQKLAEKLPDVFDPAKEN